jgi:hypothetical protein
MMLNEQAIDGDFITIHNKTVRTDIAAPAHPVAVICAPDLGVIDDRVVAVYRQVSRCSAHPGAPYSEENIRLIVFADRLQDRQVAQTALLSNNTVAAGRRDSHIVCGEATSAITQFKIVLERDGDPMPSLSRMVHMHQNEKRALICM